MPEACDFCGDPATKYPNQGPDAGHKLCDECDMTCSVCGGRHVYGASCRAISLAVYDLFSPMVNN